MKKNITQVLITILGILLLGIGFYLLKALPNMVNSPIPYVLIGIGSGTFGSGVAGMINGRIMKNSPEIAKQKEIEQNDERNLAISYKAKAKAYDCMVFVFGALMLSFALMKAELKTTLLLVFAYLFVVGYGLFFRAKYDKEM